MEGLSPFSTFNNRINYKSTDTEKQNVSTTKEVDSKLDEDALNVIDKYTDEYRKVLEKQSKSCKRVWEPIRKLVDGEWGKNKNKNKNEKEQYKEPHALEKNRGMWVGLFSELAVMFLTPMLYRDTIRKQFKKVTSLSEAESSSIEKVMGDVIKKTGLKDKGVEVVRASSENKNEITEILFKEFDKNLILKITPKKYKKHLAKKYASMFAEGKNACYVPSSKKIILPEKKLLTAFFHEAGHAMNDNLFKSTRVLQRCRLLTILAAPIALIGFWKTKKAKGEKSKNDVDRTTNFIKENLGKLTFITFLPMLMEEGLATIKGNKLARECLDSNLAKKVAKTNAIGFATYLIAALTSTFAISLGSTMKDKIAHRKPITEENISIKNKK